MTKQERINRLIKLREREIRASNNLYPFIDTKDYPSSIGACDCVEIIDGVNATSCLRYRFGEFYMLQTGNGIEKKIAEIDAAISKLESIKE